MSTGPFTYSPTVLHDVSMKLGNGATEIAGKLSDLKNQTTPLQSAFVGSAAQSYQQLFDQWQTSGKQLQEALTQLSAMLAKMSANADAMEQANRTIAAG